MAGGCKVRSVLTYWPDSLSRNSTFYKWIKQVIFFNGWNIKQNMAYKKWSGNASGMPWFKVQGNTSKDGDCKVNVGLLLTIYSQTLLWPRMYRFNMWGKTEQHLITAWLLITESQTLHWEIQ